MICPQKPFSCVFFAQCYPAFVPEDFVARFLKQEKAERNASKKTNRFGLRGERKKESESKATLSDFIVRFIQLLSNVDAGPKKY
ncbi:MAG: hypothetical protein IJ138_05380, partial [Clostridia bacterium]|nr:hypothetical protein [Clostridia bacterium]